MSKKLFAIAFIAGMLALPQAASANPNPTHIPGHPRVNEVNGRIQDQRQRIVQGTANGSLSPAEQRRLHHQYAAIKREEHLMRQAHGGHLTRQDQLILNHQLNRRSRAIYRNKHD